MFIWKCLYFVFIFEEYLCWNSSLRIFFSLYHFKDTIILSSCLHIWWGDSSFLLMFFCVLVVFFPFHLVFSLIFGFQQFEYYASMCGIFECVLLGFIELFLFCAFIIWKNLLFFLIFFLTQFFLHCFLKFHLHIS